VTRCDDDDDHVRRWRGLLLLFRVGGRHQKTKTKKDTLSFLYILVPNESKHFQENSGRTKQERFFFSDVRFFSS
jgi:hypothetical protein